MLTEYKTLKIRNFVNYVLRNKNLIYFKSRKSKITNFKQFQIYFKRSDSL